MSRLVTRTLALSVVLLDLTQSSWADEPGPFRTDKSSDDSLPWFELRDGQFPPAGSAHYFDGELIGIDHINRRGVVRVSRTDKQRRSHWDLPVRFEMLPYASVELCGTKAAFRDIPLGTHVHGLWYQRDFSEPPPKSEFHNRKSTEADFTRCFQLQDDFSYWQSRGVAWQIESIDREQSKVVSRQVAVDEQADVSQDPVEFDLLPQTRVWLGDRLADATELEAGQTIQFRLTWATLYGPGRLTDVWADEAARHRATERQQVAHAQFTKERGLAGWIESVDNSQRTLTVTFFDLVAADLLEEFGEKASSQVIVAEPTLRNYDQVNDRKRGTIVEATPVEAAPGSAGLRVQIKVDLLLEGFRPGRVIRVFGPGWAVRTLPQEENLWPARD